MDLSNARIIEWESTEERGFEITCLVEVAHVARREARGAKFREGGTYYTEQQAAELGARVVAEFPAPSLAEIVGDAPAFTFQHRDTSGQAGQCIAWWGGDGWMWARRMFYGGDSTPSRLDQIPVGDLASVVPLVPREVVS